MFGLTKKSITIKAPVSGAVIQVSKLNDPVFKENILGQGIAILPDANRVVAPADGVVSQMFTTGHAVSVLTDSGVELLIHIGIDTVELKGKHYTKRKESGDIIKTGDVLIQFDLESIAGEGFETVTPIVVCNPDEFADISFASEGTVKEGDVLITIKPGKKT